MSIIIPNRANRYKIIQGVNDERLYRKNRGGFLVIVHGKMVLHLPEILYFDEAYNLLRDYKKLMWYLKQRKGARFSRIPNNELFTRIKLFEPFQLATL
jgi:hypothetical protein